MNNGIIDPVNHKITEAEVKDIAHYKDFLDELTDVPASVPLKNYAITKAGISDQMAYVKVKSIFDNNPMTMLCTIKMQVALSGHRGIHMSRCEEALFSLLDETHESLDDFAFKLAAKIKTLQSADTAYIDVEGIYIAERKTIKSRKTSHDRMTFYANIELSNSGAKRNIGVAAFNMTGCPCTETYTKFSVVPRLLEAGLSLEKANEVINITNSGTHTQRGQVSLHVEKTHDEVNYKMIYDALNESCHLVFELLKRPDEHELVVRVLRKPQFTEDVVRDAIDACITKAGRYLEKDSVITATSVLFDSIHIHDVCTEITKTYGELLEEKNGNR